ncbi:TonB-dependent receptor [Glycocaulis profundi]|nr:TonB-dependent receptor [Glycocaulis profundi]
MAFIKKLACGASIAALAALAPVAAVHAQQTASQMRGAVTDPNGAPIANASVTITHVPTGTVNRTTTSANGNFNASGLRVGGPYSVAVQADGFQADVAEGISLDPGSNAPLRLRLNRAGATEVIAVTGRRIQTLDLNNGAGSAFSSQDIANQPSFSRDLTGTLLRDPLTNAAGPGNLRVAGTNPRVNAFVVDGLRQGDDFGLSSSTYATTRSPISLDTVEAASVVASDYSVFTTGFQGGLVNVVTKSGTNDFSGTLSYYRSGNDFQSNTAFDRFISSPDFIEEEYGFTLGGPILQDRLFFFVGYEKFETAGPIDFTSNDASSGFEPGFFEALRGMIQNSLGYDVGERPLTTSIPRTSERYFARVDWNINPDHRVTASYQRTEETDTSGVFNNQFDSAWYDTPLELDNYTLQAFSNWTPDFTTTARLGYKEYIRGQNCRAGTDVGQIQVNVTPTNVVGTPLEGLVTNTPGFQPVGGCDRSRHANEFNDTRLQVYLQGDYTWGDHVTSFGGSFDRYELYNLFVQDNSGNFVFQTPQDLIDNRATVTYRAPQSNVRSEGATELSYDIIALFAQDEWQILPDLSVNFGLRYERYQQDQDLVPRPDFDLVYGANARQSLDGIDLFQPRAGFRWDAASRTTVSGGFGLFAGGDPNVWFANTYLPQNFSYTLSGLENVDPRVVPQELIDLVANSNPTDPAPIDTIAPGFEMPSNWRGSLKLAQEFDLEFDGFSLGRDYVFETQVLYSRTHRGYAWRNLAQIGLPVGTAPDGRPIYTDLAAFNTGTGNNFQNVIELYNVNEGESLVYTAALSKNYENGLGFYLSYAYQDVDAIIPAASSVAVSNYNAQVGFDRNSASAGRSLFETEHRFGINMSYETEIFGDLRSRLDVSGLISSGTPFSYTYTTVPLNPMFGRDAVQQSSNADLLYVPLANDPSVIYGAGFNQDAFNDLIERQGLTRGEIAPRNGHTSPWQQLWNLRFQQDLPFASFGVDRFRNNRATFVVDIENFPNLLNNEWGRTYGTPGGGFGAVPVVTGSLVRADDPDRPLNSRNSASPSGSVPGSQDYNAAFDPALVCQSAGACVYRYDTLNTTNAGRTGIESTANSLYRIRLGIRYEF